MADKLNLTVEFEKVDPRAKYPIRKTQNSVGYDIYAISNTTIPAGTIRKIATGLKIKNISNNIYIQLVSRSGLAIKHGIVTQCGLIDTDFKGEIQAVLHNTSTSDFSVDPDTSISQMVFYKRILFHSHSVSNKGEVRGHKGFGSSD